MRILYHHRTLGDGAEGIHVSAMVDAFRWLGHEVEVASVIGKRTNVPNARIRLFQRLRAKVPQVAYEMMELGYSLVGYRMLVAQLRAWKADLLYERHALFNVAGLAAVRRTGVRHVLEVNSPLAYERSTYERLALGGLARRLERAVCARADLAVVVSSPLKDYLVQEGVAGERIAVIPNGVDGDRFQPDARAREEVRVEAKIPADSVVVGFAGILRPWHGVDVLIEAISRMRAGWRDVRLLVVGDGPSRSGLEELAWARGLDKVVTFTGRVPHAEMPRYLAAFDIGVSPRAAFYASPMKVLEYMAMGMAVLAPRMANFTDVVTEGRDGVLFRPEDPDDLARQLDRLISDADERRRIGDAARATIVGSRTWAHNAARILALVRSPR